MHGIVPTMLNSHPLRGPLVRSVAPEFRSEQLMSRTCPKLISALLVLLFTFSVAQAQSDKGRISGLVTDPQGLAVPNARLELLNQDTSAKQSLESDDTGHYAFSGLAAGRYQLSVQVDGFNPFVSEEIKLAPEQAMAC